MLKSILKILVIIIALTLIIPTPIFSCSAISVTLSGKVIVGGNDDVAYSEEIKIWAIPSGNGLFGRMCIGVDVVSGRTPVGMKCMNDQGLVITYASVPISKTPFDPNKPQFRHNFLEKIISECTNVKQAIAILKTHTLPQEHNAFVHLMLTDATGDSVVAEWVDGGVKIIRSNGPILFMTNHLLSKPETAGEPNSRYNRALPMLPQIKVASSESVLPILKEISVYVWLKGVEIGTLQSTIWDITGRKLYLFYKRDFDHPLIFNLDEELAKVAHAAYLRDLFPNPVPFETRWRDENGLVKESLMKK